MILEKNKTKDSARFWAFSLTTIGFAVGVGEASGVFHMCAEPTAARCLSSPTCVVIVLIGIPFDKAEISMGYVTQKTAVGAYQTLRPGTKWYASSYLHILVALLVFCYTVPI